MVAGACSRMMFKVWGYGDTGQQYAQLNIVRGFAVIGLSFVARGPSINFLKI
ncbi:hypothetical protein AGR1C_Lc90111 [Agrobacterium fabacearum TT111]|nr:hypothetical protein AGR1C_Lc90111 [Agrobacterium fabacearum TT111]